MSADSLRWFINNHFFLQNVRVTLSVDRQQAHCVDLELAGALKSFGSSSSWENLNSHRVSLQNIFSTLYSQIKVSWAPFLPYVGCNHLLWGFVGRQVAFLTSSAPLGRCSTGDLLQFSHNSINEVQHQFHSRSVQGHSSHWRHRGIYLC